MTNSFAEHKSDMEALLDFFTSWTGLPVGLYEHRGGELQLIQTRVSLVAYEPHCRLIQSFPGGKAACEADQCNRAHGAIHDGVERLLPCYAGMYNQLVPVRIGDAVRAVLLFGEMQVTGDDFTQTALTRHEQACRDLQLTSEQSEELKNRLLTSKRFSPEQIEILKAKLPQLVAYLYILYDREQRLKLNTAKVVHELGTRLQNVMATSENLMEKASDLNPDEIRSRARAIFGSALALETVINNFSDYAGAYNFSREPLAPLLFEAKSTYFAEAERHRLRIDIRFERDPNGPVLEISKQHLQLALNNLMHNAIKYSFRDLATGKRFVRVIGTPLPKRYAITFENYGVGILQSEIDSKDIFQDGYQGVLTEREFRTGSGKGLFFTYNAIKKHHGDIRVTSKLKSGETHPEGQPHLTRFTIYLPYQQPK